MLTSRDTGSCTIVMLNIENIGIAVEISLLCALEFEICLGGKNTPQLPANVAKKTVAGTRVKHSCKLSDVIGAFWEAYKNAHNCKETNITVLEK